MEGHAYNFNKSLSNIGFDDDIVKCDDDFVFYDKDWLDKFKKQMDKNTAVCYGKYGNHWGGLMMIPKEILRELGYMNEEFGKYGYADVLYRSRILRAGFKIHTIDSLHILHDDDNPQPEFKNTISKELAEERARLVSKNKKKYDIMCGDLIVDKRNVKVYYDKYKKPNEDIPSVRLRLRKRLSRVEKDSSLY